LLATKKKMLHKMNLAYDSCNVSGSSIKLCFLKRENENFEIVYIRPSTVFGWSSRLRTDIVFNNLLLNGLKNGKIEGKGKFTFPNKSFFEGEFKQYVKDDGTITYKVTMENGGIIDDLIDSGSTKKASQKYANIPFFALLDKKRDLPNNEWVRFPWDTLNKEEGVEDNIRRILQFIGEDPNRNGLKETPYRVSRSYEELFSGYKLNPQHFMKCFESTCSELVLVRDIEMVSFCEHHMLPFYGKAHIAYIPNGRVIGVSKIARVLEIYAKRLQIQERITEQVTTALMTGLNPLGAACMIEAKHMCMICRGVQKQHSVMVTSSLKGVFLEDQKVRSEFYSLVKG
jgi:GTP cyclohydrolase I